MTVAVKQSEQFTLVHPKEDITYVFRLHEGDVCVVHHDRGRVGNYFMSLEEARDLWRSLRKKCYIRFQLENAC